MKHLPLVFFVAIFILLVSFSDKTYAASLISASDTITSSLPASTAMHTIQFTTATAIPTGGKIVISFPGPGNNTASSSASTFACNGLSSSNIKTNNIICSTLTISAPAITCTASSGVAAQTTVTFLIGCSLSSGTTCSTQAPTIISPTKTAPAGTADTWRIAISTQNSSSSELDYAAVGIATIEGVQVLVPVDPSLTFTIGGVNNATAINTGNASGCTNTETTNAGPDATSTAINLGSLKTTPSAINTKVGNIAAQLLTVTTNAQGGYALTATSSGPLQNSASGFDIMSSTSPQAFPSGTPWFGIHPCGLDVSAATWTSSGTDQNCNTYITGSTGNICKYGWPASPSQGGPTSTSAFTLASDTTGPVGNLITPGNGIVSVEYAAGVDTSVPAGTYQSVITYVATPTF